MAEIQVTPWGTRQELPNDRAAAIHDCLWEIAQEQAVLDRMKQTGESWDAASPKISQQEIRKHLDTVCDDNGFRRLDGGGNGRRDPNLIYTGERITVRTDPARVDKPAAGIDTKPSADAYSKVVAAEDGLGPDLNKKAAVDKWLETVPGFPTLSEGTKAGLLTAYGADGMDHQNLAKLGGSAAFRGLDEKQQQQLLTGYGAEGKSYATGEVDRIVSTGGDDAKQRLQVFGSHGFFRMEDPAQKVVLDRYNSDAQFRSALNEIAGQDNFKDKNSTEQAHALDILGRYSGRKGEGYGEQPEDKRKAVLVTLYNDVLSTKAFNLNDYRPKEQGETGDQSKKIEDFANNRAGEIGGNKTEPQAESTPLEDQYWD